MDDNKIKKISVAFFIAAMAAGAVINFRYLFYREPTGREIAQNTAAHIHQYTRECKEKYERALEKALRLRNESGPSAVVQQPQDVRDCLNASGRQGVIDEKRHWDNKTALALAFISALGLAGIRIVDKGSYPSRE